MALWALRAFLCAMLWHAAAGCGGADAWQPPDGAKPLAVARVAPSGFQGSYIGRDDALRLVIRDPATWSTFWETYVPYLDGRPQIDFDSETVIAAGMGWRPTGGYHVEIPSAYLVDFQILVVVCEISPPRDSFTTQGETSPLTLVAIPRIDDAHVTFVEQPAVGACPAQLD